VIRRARSYVKLWPLVILALCIVAVTPLLRADSPCTHDGGPHHFRVAGLRHALQSGIIYTRFLPDLAFGYGYPFFNYRAALPYYMVLVPHLAGVPLPISSNLIYALSIIGSALTAYLLARDLFGPLGGFVAAIAYAYAPYQLLDALVRGNLPESIALALFPLILWTFRRLALTGKRRWFLTSVLSLTTLYLSHNISTMLFTPFLVAHLVVLWLAYRRQGFWVRVGLALALAVGLAAFFLIPAFVEKGYVHLHMSHSTRNNDFHHNFVGLAELLSPPAPRDTALLNPPVQVHLGLAQTILAAIGLAVGLYRFRDREAPRRSQRRFLRHKLARQRHVLRAIMRSFQGKNRKAPRERCAPPLLPAFSRERRATLLFLALAAVALIWMITPSSLWVWENVPVLRFVQFPWRLAGRAILPLALLAAACVPSPEQNTPQRSRAIVRSAVPIVLVALLVLAAIPHTYPLSGYCPQEPYPTINDLFAYEHRTGRVGLAATGSFFPIDVRQRPTGSPLEAQYAAGEPVTRFGETVLPEGATLIDGDYGPNRARITLETPTPFQARYLAFYFPGWRAAIDGESVDITPTDPEGLISVAVPAGRHTLTFQFGETPLRLVVDIISLLSLVALVIITARYSQTSNAKSQISRAQSVPSFAICHLIFLSVSILLIGTKLIIDRTDSPFRRPGLQPGSTLPGIEHPLSQRYADGMLLIGYDQDREAIRGDSMLRVDLYLGAYAQPGARYQTVMHLVGPDGMRWSQPDSFHPRGYTACPFTTIWSPDVYALDSHEIEPLPGTPPGTYDVVLTVFDEDTLAALSPLNDEGRPLAPTLTLGQITLTRPRHPAQISDDNPLDLPLDEFTLLTADFDRVEAAPGDPVLFVTHWRADERPTEDVTLHLTLLALDGSPAARYDLPLSAKHYPTSGWQPGDVWRGQSVVHLPADLADGPHTWTIRLPSTQEHTLAQIDITAPPHVFDLPALSNSLSATLGDTATLVGFDVAPQPAHPGDTLAVTLAWRAEGSPTTSYHVFLHLIGPQGQMVAQSDGIPAGWSRPTTGWIPGEYVLDEHTLVIPPDAPTTTLTLLAGLYDPDSGTRLTDAVGVDAIQLTTVSVEGQ
jgi:hypothetical protein